MTIEIDYAGKGAFTVRPARDAVGIRLADSDIMELKLRSSFNHADTDTLYILTEQAYLDFVRWDREIVRVGRILRTWRQRLRYRLHTWHEERTNARR